MSLKKSLILLEILECNSIACVPLIPWLQIPLSSPPLVGSMSRLSAGRKGQYRPSGNGTKWNEKPGRSTGVGHAVMPWVIEPRDMQGTFCELLPSLTPVYRHPACFVHVNCLKISGPSEFLLSSVGAASNFLQ